LRVNLKKTRMKYTRNPILWIAIFQKFLGDWLITELPPFLGHWYNISLFSVENSQKTEILLTTNRWSLVICGSPKIGGKIDWNQIYG
jgi:hypothetical protein